jgi:hypothetical protein
MVKRLWPVVQHRVGREPGSDSSRAALQATCGFRAWLGENGRTIAIWAADVLGVYLTVTGITGRT